MYSVSIRIARITKFEVKCLSKVQKLDTMVQLQLEKM